MVLVRYTFEEILYNIMENVVLIGMPGVGKSTTGVILAKALSKDFIDTDLLIQVRYKKSLQDIVDAYDYLKLRNVEEEEILLLNVSNSVIATGGSAVYSEKAIDHLRKNGRIVYLKLELNELLMRIDNLGTRGIAKSKDQSFEDLYFEREKLYEKHGEIVINCKDKKHEHIVAEILQNIYAKGRG
jgi:shikimate kinase